MAGISSNTQKFEECDKKVSSLLGILVGVFSMVVQVVVVTVTYCICWWLPSYLQFVYYLSFIDEADRQLGHHFLRMWVQEGVVPVEYGQDSWEEQMYHICVWPGW